jgi:type IV secretory pathway VirB10-like protein
MKTRLILPVVAIAAALILPSCSRAAVSASAEEKKKKEAPATTRAVSKETVDKVTAQSLQPAAPPAPARAAAPPSPNPTLTAAAATPAPAPKSASTAFTNDDLRRMFGEPVASKPAGGETTGAGSTSSSEGRSALEQMAKDKKAEAEKSDRVAQAEKNLSAAQQRVADLERRALAVRNPLLARPTVSQEEHKDWDGADAAEHAKLTDADLKKAKEDVEQAKKDLDDARRGTESPRHGS